jgi:hypothetical protein
LIIGDVVYWPTREELYAMDIVASRAARIWTSRRQPAAWVRRGVLGGNLLAAGGGLIVATPTELVALDIEPRPGQREDGRQGKDK